jgi:hypothetical protein
VQENQVLSKITSLSKEIEANQRDLIEKNQEILERVQKEKELIFEVYLNEAIKVPDNINFKTALLFIKKDIDNNKTTVIFNEK